MMLGLENTDEEHAGCERCGRTVILAGKSVTAALFSGVSVSFLASTSA